MEHPTKRPMAPSSPSPADLMDLTVLAFERLTERIAQLLG